MASPRLLRQKPQVVHPILLLNADRVNDVRQIVGGVGEHPRRVIYGLAAVAQASRSLRRIHTSRKLSGFDGRFAAAQTDKTLVEVVEPCPQYLPGIGIGICGHQDDLEPARLLRWQSLQGLSDGCHLQRAHIRTKSVPEEAASHIFPFWLGSRRERPMYRLG